MNVKDLARIARPTIAEVLRQFLEDQRRRLAAKTFSQYKSATELLQHSLNGYAYQYLNKKDSGLFHRLYDAEGSEHREFCEIFGPEHILPNVGEFLGYFMVRKVMAGGETLRAAGTVTKKLAKWLAEKGYAAADEAKEAEERGGEAARDLPKAEKLASLLDEFAEKQERGDEDSEIEDHFMLTRVEPGRIWLEGIEDGREIGPIDVPESISRLCKVDWTISGIVDRVGKKWRFVEAWNVYP